MVSKKFLLNQVNVYCLLIMMTEQMIQFLLFFNVFVILLGKNICM